MKSLIPFLLLGLVLTSGCEKSITINLPEQPKKLVVNAVVLRGEPVHLILTRSLSNAESGKSVDASVAGASVLLYRDGVLVDTLEPYSPGAYYSTIEAEHGHRYRLVISHASYASVEAETAAPDAVPILGLDRTRSARNNPNYGTQDLLRVRFKDPAASGDHYILQILPGYWQMNEPLDFYGWDNCIGVSDPSFESPYGNELPGEESCLPSRSLLLRDIHFNGQEKELRMYASSSSLEPGVQWQSTDTSYASVRMYHVTPEFYNFVKSYRSAQDASGNPFAEPFNVTTNVKGGYGVFAIVSEEMFEVRD